MVNFLRELTGMDKTIIGCVHLVPLPGTPHYDAAGGLHRIVELARDDARRLIQGSIDAVLFVNEGDRPYASVADAGVVAPAPPSTPWWMPSASPCERTG